ncbi:NADPH-dependent FMN reductase [Leucobacter luti]|uniref:FMN reductase n=1 Tax=Leucobacter luti TaxID=340320 RepID=A0A4Q7U207_9MICO|nr:NAD(P)H-dependent oxidoreductase [Leucobacter luti]MBL3699347.1 NADPH-dependent oxidoreductase [Leucobacter luti]RZT66857.1 FMN reductase [Leucobacter luti]
MSTISVIVGNPKPNSRTREIAEELAARVAARTGATAHPTVDLIEHAAALFSWPAPGIDPLLEQLRTATYAVIATPTYKASYTGLLKAFLDRYPAQALAGVTAIPVFTTASDEHALAVEFTLRPLLVELGASVPTRGLAFPTPKFDRRAEVLDEWFASQGRLLPGAASPPAAAGEPGAASLAGARA